MEAQHTAFNFHYYCHIEENKKMQCLAFICLSAQKIWLESKTENKYLKELHNTVIQKNPA